MLLHCLYNALYVIGKKKLKKILTKNYKYSAKIVFLLEFIKYFIEKITFFEKSCKKIWLVLKKVVILHSFSIRKVLT